MNTNFYCPVCGRKLEQGEYYYNETIDVMLVDHCPEGCDSADLIVDEPTDCIAKQCEKNIEDFDNRYKKATKNGVDYAETDPKLYAEIEHQIALWCDEHGEDASEYQPTDIF